MYDFTDSSGRIKIAFASHLDRSAIYRIRHDVYASELSQHALNPARELSDPLDAFNLYITASVNKEIIGFISITPPCRQSYSIDKYVARDELPFPFDNGLYELRLLTVTKPNRGWGLVNLLMYAAFRWVETCCGTRVVAIGRREVLDLYLKVGLRPLGREIQSGAVKYELLSARVEEMREWLIRYIPLLNRLARHVDWRLEFPFHPSLYQSATCFHGGQFFEAIGDEFKTLERSKSVINADVLDAWFPPSPKVLAALEEYLPWLLRTSPPTNCEGMVKAIARVRGVNGECILPGAGSSDLIYLALRQWLNSSSRVLILDPTYGEYAHLLEQVIGSKPDRLMLSRNDGYRLNLASLEERLNKSYDLIILVNPNSPTGRYVPRSELEYLLGSVPTSTRIWIDETYIEYVGTNQSLESFAAGRENVVVCKSMSKVYALSGARVAYLCAGHRLIKELKPLTPPWAVSLLGQVAAVAALHDQEYYVQRYEETHVLRRQLADGLKPLSNLEIVPSVANFLLCHLPKNGIDAATVVEGCRLDGLFVRDAKAMGTQLGNHALRIAVKDEATNNRMLKILARVLDARALSAGSGALKLD